MSTLQVLSSPENLAILPESSQALETLRCQPLHEYAPEWLTIEYLENSLCKYYNDAALRIHEINATPACGKGENYTATMLRIKAEFITGSRNRKTGYYIAKCSYEDDEFTRKMMEPYDIFNREMIIYEDVLPKFQALLLEVGDTEKIYALTVAVDYQHNALLFEDLSVSNYTMPDRLQGLDMPHVKLALRKLAKLHAASAVLNERQAGCLEKYDRGMFNRYTDNYAPYFVGNLKACTSMLEQWGEEYQQYAKKLKKLQPLHMELCKRVFDATKGHLNVLAHGDLWTNNILFKYDEATGAPVDAVIIDYQYAVWGSPAIDLFNLFNTSLKSEMHLHQQDELIQDYYYTLADTLRKLNYEGNIPSLHKFHLQLEEKAYFAVNCTCAVQPVQRAEDTTDADFKALMMEDERAQNFKSNCMKNTYCQNIIRQVLPKYDRRGLLDADQ